MSGDDKTCTFTKKEFIVSTRMPLLCSISVEESDRNPSVHICNSSGLHHAKEKKRPCLGKIITLDIMFEHITSANSEAVGVIQLENTYKERVLATMILFGYKTE